MVRLQDQKAIDTKGAIRVEYALGGKGWFVEEMGAKRACVLYDRDSGKERWRWQPPGGPITFALAPDGRHVALGNANGTIYLVRLQEHGRPR